MRFFTLIQKSLRHRWMPRPPVRCCPACCINIAGFR